MLAQSAPAKPLAGLKVLDITHMLAGPYCTWLLGLLGAEVIKVERPGEGDFARAIAPFHGGESLYFMSVNRNKRSIAVNLKTEEGKQILRDLIARSDILVENNRAGVMDRLGLGYDDAKALNPGLVYASISGYGQTGPYRHKPAFDVIAQAISGMMSITGQEGGPPTRVGVSIGDIASGLFATVAILAAIEGRHGSGEGAFIDVSMMDCQMALMENAISRYLNAGDVPERLGSRHPLIARSSLSETKDFPIAVCVDTEPQWQRFCAALDLEPLLHDPRFQDGPMRALNHSQLEPLLNAVFASGRRDDFIARLRRPMCHAARSTAFPKWPGTRRWRTAGSWSITRASSMWARPFTTTARRWAARPARPPWAPTACRSCANWAAAKRRSPICSAPAYCKPARAAGPTPRPGDAVRFRTLSDLQD